MFDLFERQRLDALARARGTTREVHSVLTADLLFDIATWLETTQDILTPYLLDTIITGFRTGAFRVSLSASDVTSSDPAVIAILEILNNKSRSISYTTSKALAELVQNALEQGWGPDRIAQEITATFEGFKASRARTIAITNATAGFEAGQYASFRRAGIRASRWLSERDGLVRLTHDAADGQEKPIDVPFLVGRSLMLHPGDPAGPAEEVINCRCTLLPLT